MRGKLQSPNRPERNGMLRMADRNFKLGTSGRHFGRANTPCACATAVALCLLFFVRPLAAQFHTPPTAGPVPEVSSDLLMKAGIDQKLNAQVPLDLQFRNSEGETVRLGDLLVEKPAILQLVYYECPMLCKLATDGLVRTLRSMSFDVGGEFDVLTVSFDPHETVQLSAKAKRTTLRRYGRDDRAAAGWHFLTGDEDSIRRLTETVGFRYAWDPTLGQYVHGAGIIILTPEGKISRYLNGVEFMARDIRLGLVEASNLEIASPSDQVLLLCYQYNPSIGKYGWRIQRIIEVLGITTMTSIIGAIVLMLRRERRKQNTVHTQSEPAGGSRP